MYCPTKDHMDAMYQVLRYLKRNPGRGLFFKKSVQNVEAYSDVDWAGSHIERLSTSGYCTYLWVNLLMWRSKKQSVVVKSSREAEHRALAHGICEGMWLKRLLNELKFEFGQPLRVMCDN